MRREGVREAGRRPRFEDESEEETRVDEVYEKNEEPNQFLSISSILGGTVFVDVV
jgi:hypothetical protein